MTRAVRALLAVSLFVAGPLAAQTTAIRAGRLLDPATGVAASNKVIVVEQGRIVAVSDEALASAGAVIIDLSAYTLLPGLIDAHVHLGIGGPPRDNALAIVRAGFTTVLDLGARTTRILRIRDSINQEQIPGPRVLAAGIWVGTKNGVCEFNGIGLTGGPDAFRARVRENVDAGADVIKVCVTGWPADAAARPQEYEIADADLEAVVNDAHAAGKMVVAHAISEGGARAALRAGVDGLAHAALIDSALAAEMARRRVFIVPTLASLSAGSPAEAAALARAVGLAARAGVPIALGTDGGVLPHGQNALEVIELAKLTGIGGALRAATLDAARALRLQDSVGAIKPGYSADIIAVDGDPTRDPTALQRVRFVMSRGRVLRPAGDTTRAGVR